MVLGPNPSIGLDFSRAVALNGKDGPLLARVGVRLRPGLATLQDFVDSEYGRADPTLYEISEARVMGRRAFQIESKQVDPVPLRYFIEIDAARGLWLQCVFQVFVEGAHTTQFAGEIAELMDNLRVGPALQVAVENTPEHPFALSIRIDGGDASEVARVLGAYRNVRLLAHVFDRDFNVLKLDDRFMLNGVWDSRGKHLQPGAASANKDLPEAAQKASLPIAIALHGQEEIQLTLVPSLGDLAKWSRRYQAQGVHLPSIPKPLQVSMDFEVVGTDARGNDEIIALGTKSVSVDWIGRVVGRRFEEPTILQQNRLGDLGASLERRAGALADYRNPPFNDALGERRVLIEKRSDPFYRELAPSGSTPGMPVQAGERIRVGDAIRINASDMAAYGLSGLRAPRKTRSGCVAVRFEFLDGVQAELIVYEDAGPFVMTVGADADATGFGEGWVAWSYFAANYRLGQVRDRVIEVVLKGLAPTMAPGFGTASGVNDAIEVFSFLVKQANVRHIRLNSRVYAEFDGAGNLHLTTREGRPLVYAQTTEPEGLVIPTGKTGSFEDRAAPSVTVTDAATAVLADQRLALLDAPPMSTTVLAPATAVGPTPSTVPALSPDSSRRAAVERVVLDEVAPGSLADWTGLYDPGQFNPRFIREEVRSPYDGSTAIRTRAVGNTLATCETKWTRRIYLTGPRDSSETRLEAHVDFDFDGTSYNLPSLSFELLDAQDRSLGRRTYFGRGMMGQFNRSQLATTGYVELRTAKGLHQFDLAKMGANIRFEKIAVYLQNYACEGENSVVFDHLVLLPR